MHKITVVNNAAFNFLFFKIFLRRFYQCMVKNVFFTFLLFVNHTKNFSLFLIKKQKSVHVYAPVLSSAQIHSFCQVCDIFFLMNNLKKKHNEFFYLAGGLVLH